MESTNPQPAGGGARERESTTAVVASAPTCCRRHRRLRRRARDLGRLPLHERLGVGHGVDPLQQVLHDFLLAGERLALGLPRPGNAHDPGGRRKEEEVLEVEEEEEEEEEENK